MVPTAAHVNVRGCVKGVVLKSRLEYVKSRGGAPMVELVLSRLRDGHRKVLSDLILPVGWYPFEINEELDRTIALCLGGGRPLLREMGAQSALDGLGSTQKNLVRERDLHGLLKHSAQIHKLYYDTGYRTYEWVAAKSAVLRTFECKSFSPEDCQTNLGWHEAALGLCGGKAVRIVHTRCRANGDKCCEFTCQWE